MSDRLYVSTRKGLFTFDRSGSTWTITRAAFIAENCTLVAPDSRDGSVYCALEHGHFGPKLHRSDDEGETWNEVACPAYPERPEGSPPEVDSYGKQLPSATKLIWAITSAGSDRPGALWCGTIPGGLFRSADRGESWELCRGLWDHPGRKEWFGGGADYPGIHSVCVDPNDSRHVFAAVSCGGVWETTDEGETWNARCKGMRAEYMPPERAFDPNIQDPHIMVACASEPATMWVQHHNGIFVTRDFARSWTELENVEPSSFGFAVAVHPNEPETAWFVPGKKDEERIPVDGKLVVTRTRDGGRTVESLRAGLPQEHAYDIVFRHALDVDDSGDCVAFGSTTGNIWMSGDQGDSWERLSTTLPPVYSVRFVK